MFGRSIRLFDLFGFEVKVDLSWVVLALLISWTLATGYFPMVLEGLDAATYWKMGITGAIGLFASIIYHELCHSLVARHYGMRIRGITLFIFGGVAEMTDEPPSPKVEFLMAAAGPASSFILAGILWLLTGWLGDVGLDAATLYVIEYLAVINTLLATFNLIPAFPLDGGRVLRAWLWHKSGDIHTATLKASKSGGWFGMMLIILGVFNLVSGNVAGGIWMGLIGLFVRNAAQQSYVQLEAKTMLEDESVARFMTQGADTVPPDISLRQFVEDHIYRHYHEFFPVVDAQGRILGAIGIAQLRRIPKEKWDGLDVGEVMEKAEMAVNTVRASDNAMNVVRLMQESGHSRLMVTDDAGQLAGIITLKDVLRLIALKMDIEGRA